MRIIFLFAILCCLWSCKTQQKQSTNNSQNEGSDVECFDVSVNSFPDTVYCIDCINKSKIENNFSFFMNQLDTQYVSEDSELAGKTYSLQFIIDTFGSTSLYRVHNSYPNFNKEKATLFFKSLEPFPKQIPCIRQRGRMLQKVNCTLGVRVVVLEKE